MDQTLYHNDLSALPLGSLPFRDSRLTELYSLPLPEISGGFSIPISHPSWSPDNCFRVIERGLGKYIEAVGSSPHCENRILLCGDTAWGDYRLRAVVTPLSFDGGSPAGGFCGVVARYCDANNYLALVLDRDGQVKLLERRDGKFVVLDAKPLEFCIGQSLTLTLTLTGNSAHGTAGPYAGATHVKCTIGGTLTHGKVGFISDVAARFGPFSVECTPEEAKRIDEIKTTQGAALAKSRARYPKMRLERTVPLQGLVHGYHLRFADVNGDGRPEIIAAQCSPEIAKKFSMTRLTCLSVLDLDGKLLWQAGAPVGWALPTNPDGGQCPPYADLPFQVHDLYGDGNRVVVCVFGNDVQIRDGRSGKVLFSASTPDMQKSPLSADFKEITSNFGAPWGDEALNMNVAAIAFCDTHGSGGRREILIKDDFHHLAVLDALNSPALQPILRHRGNHGRYPWIGDIDGDGREEILAGYSLIDDDGKSAWSLPLGGFASCAAVLDPLNPGGADKKILLCADGELLILNAGGTKSLRPLARIGPATRFSVAKFRSDVPGLQILSVSGGLFRLHDATGKPLWSKELPALGLSGSPVNWSGRSEELALYSMSPGAGLLDGHGEIVVEAPASGPSLCSAIAPGYCSDGRDAILAWDANELAIYVPEDELKTTVYKPVRPNGENHSVYAARLSLPPGW